MPSDLAFLGLPDTELVTEYDSCTLGMEYYRQAGAIDPVNLGVSGLSIRSVYQPIGALQALGINIDTNSEIFKALRTVIITNYSILMLQGAYRSVVAAKTARDTAVAATETAAMAVAQQWTNIALAAGAALLVAGSLGIGYAVGEKVGSGDWHLPSGDFSSPQARREMERSLPAEVRRRG